MFNAKDFVITNVQSIQMWSPVPTYEKLDIGYCAKMGAGCLIGSFEAMDGLKNYLNNRKRNNEKYKDFWSDTSNVKFNNDKTQYLCMILGADSVKDIKVTME